MAGSKEPSSRPFGNQPVRALPLTVLDPVDAVRELTAPNDRPKSACYVPKQCREHRPGAGGSPLASAQRRPASANGAAAAAARAKTERWREAGQLRWPPPPWEAKYAEAQSDTVPFRQATSYHQGRWQNELWMRSLRKPGLLLQDPVFASPGAECKELHEEWRDCPPYTPRALAYSGATASGKVAIPNEKVPDRWVERPVAVGKYALDHMDGNRYKFDMKTPRLYTDEALQQRHEARSPSPRPMSGRKSPGGRWRAMMCQA